MGAPVWARAPAQRAPFAKTRLRRSPSLRDYLCSSYGAPCAGPSPQLSARHSQRRAYGALRRFATIFAHQMALPVPGRVPSSARAIRKVAPTALSVASRLPLLIKWRSLCRAESPAQRAPFAKTRLRRSPSLRDYLCSSNGAPCAGPSPQLSARHSQSRACGALRCFAATFAHQMALPQPRVFGKNLCEHNFCPNHGGWLSWCLKKMVVEKLEKL